MYVWHGTKHHAHVGFKRSFHGLDKMILIVRDKTPLLNIVPLFSIGDDHEYYIIMVKFALFQ